MIGEMIKKYKDYIPEEEEIGENQGQEGDARIGESYIQEGKILKEEDRMREEQVREEAEHGQ